MFHYLIILGFIIYMHEMCTVANDDHVAWVAYKCVCHAPAPCKTAKRIELLFWVETLRVPMHIVLDVGTNHPMEGKGKCGGGNFARCGELALLCGALRNRSKGNQQLAAASAADLLIHPVISLMIIRVVFRGLVSCQISCRRVCTSWQLLLSRGSLQLRRACLRQHTSCM